MPNKYPLLKLSREEEQFLRSWIHDEAHYREGVGLAKQLQRQRDVVPADLAVLIAAALPDPVEQELAASHPPSAEPPCWPWSWETLAARLEQARAVLSERQRRMVGR